VSFIVIARSEATKQSSLFMSFDGLLRFARNDDENVGEPQLTPR